MYLAVKGFTLTSYIKLVATRKKDSCVTFSGTAGHLFWDYYDFNAGTSLNVGGEIGNLPEDYLIGMVNIGIAKNFFTRAEAHQTVTGAAWDIMFPLPNNFEMNVSEYRNGLGGAESEVIARFPSAQRPKRSPPKKGGWP